MSKILEKGWARVFAFGTWMALAGAGIAHAQSFDRATTNPVLLLRESCGTPGGALQTAGTAGGNGAIDPGELVEVRFAFTNRAAVLSTLSVTLLASGGVTSPGVPQFVPGPVESGDRVEVVFQFKANGSAGGSITPVLAFNSGASSLGTLDYSLSVGKEVLLTSAFTSPGAITINAFGVATPYPASLTVPDTFTGNLTSAKVKLTGFAHTHPSDTQVLLVGPAGQKVLLLAAAGGETSVSGLDITFDDSAANSIGATGPLASGSFRPTALQTGFAFPANAPAPPYATTLSSLLGQNPRGTWQLFVVDGSVGDDGQITGGWELQLETRELQSCNSGGLPSFTTFPASPQSTVEDSTLTLTVDLSDNDTPVAGLVVTAHSSRPSLVPDANITLVRTATGVALGLKPVANGFGVGPDAGAEITVRVTDKDGLFAEQSFRLDVISVNGEPFVSSFSNLGLAPGEASDPIPFTIGDEETPADQLTLFGSSSNTGIVSASGIVFGGAGGNRSLTITPVANVSGFTTISVSVIDPEGGSARVEFLVVVSRPNELPTLGDIPSMQSLPNVPVTVNIVVGDVETPADRLTLSATSSNQALVPDSNLAFSGEGAARKLIIVPTASATGQTVIIVKVADLNGGVTVRTFGLKVAPPPPLHAPPVLSLITNRITSPGSSIDIPFIVTDADSDLTNLTFTVTADLTSLVPPGASEVTGSGTNRVLRISPAPNQSGIAQIVLTAKDETGESASATFFLGVTVANTLPEITKFQDVTIDQGQVTAPFEFGVADQETPFEELRVTGSSSDQELVPDANITFEGTGFARKVIVRPAANRSGTVRITITVTDGADAFASESFQLTVKAVAPPVSPVLKLELAGAQATLSWPVIATGFVLEQTASLTAPQWTRVNETVTVSGNSNVVKTTVTGNAFFRLRHD